MQNLTDAELLAAYVTGENMPQGDTCGKTPGDAAFGELMRRHGAMVYRACHRLLKDAHEAEDASQAVFVVLARKAGKLRKGDLSAWLYRVAHHVAAETVRRRMRRTGREDAYAAMEAIQAGEFASPDAAESDVLGLLDTVLLSLPERYRQAVILRYLQNHSEKDAAQLAGVPLGTLSGRASQGIAMLRQRLAKRGVALSGVALASLLASEASAAVPETLLPSILAVVKTAVATTAAGTVASTTAGMLAKGAMKAMFIAQVKTAAVVTAAALVVAGSGAIVAQEVAAQKKTAKEPAVAQPGKTGVDARSPTGDTTSVGLVTGKLDLETKRLTKLPKPFRLDGSLDEWTGVKPVAVADSAAFIFPAYLRDAAADTNSWRGPEDLSAKAWLATDGEALLIASEVTDDKQVNDMSGKEIHKGDAMQVGLVNASSNRWNLCAALTAKGIEIQQWDGPDKKLLNSAKCAIKRDDVAAVTRYEWRMPLADFGVVPGQECTFYFLFFDADGLMTDRWEGGKMVPTPLVRRLEWAPERREPFVRQDWPGFVVGE